MLPEAAVPAPPMMVFVAAFGEQGTPAGLRLLHELRALGVRADTDYRASTLKAHLRQADRLGAAFTLIIGDDEVSKGHLLLRNMRTKEQQELPLSDALKAVVARLR
jgi:histidyl-tRNA synthetase